MQVAVVVQDEVEAFGLGALCELWAEEYHPEDDNPVFDFRLVTANPGRVRGSSGYDLYVEHGFDAAAKADLVCVAPKRDFREVDPGVCELLRAADARGAWIFAHCTAVFTLGEAGLLDGRRCTTHWRYADELARRYRTARVEPDVLYRHEGNLITGAGSAAGLDAGLYLTRELFGARAAQSVARRMVVPPYRDGGQAQFISRPVPDCEAATLGDVLAWIVGHLDEDLDVESLARRATMSSRTFARRFREETGTTPHAWITRQRVWRAEQLLESTAWGVEQIATEVGFSGAAVLRHHFSRLRGLSPHAYRRRFAPGV